MALIDYGAVALKNGKLLNTKMFTPMLETCGFEDGTKELNLLPGMNAPFNDNYFVVVGNRKILFGFYKNVMQWWADDFNLNSESMHSVGREYFCDYSYSGWKSWCKFIDNTEVIVKPKNGYYVATFEIDNDKYKVYFGYGVDAAWYKKTRLVNYYRTCPRVLLRHFKWWLEETWTDILWRIRK